MHKYTGNVQTFTAPSATTYKLEIWGAKGSGQGGNDGYSKGTMTLTAGRNLYICVGQYGGGGRSVEYYYNGGGGGDAAGGGATHIATTNRGELYNYLNYKGEIVMVAGGGGGGERFRGGYGGGTTGGDAGMTELDSEHYTITAQSRGGTQTAGGAEGASSYGKGKPGTFGRGGIGNSDGHLDWGAGGGGGWYGGGGIGHVGAAGGGSGYLNTSLIQNASMINGACDGSAQALFTWMPVL